jgi:hypothetical protein
MALHRPSPSVAVLQISATWLKPVPAQVHSALLMGLLPEPFIRYVDAAAASLGRAGGAP